MADFRHREDGKKMLLWPKEAYLEKETDTDQEIIRQM